MKTKYKHIHFVKDLEQLDPDMPVYICRNKTEGTLGTIVYYPPWRKYEFIGEEGAGFDTSCLADIIDFMNQLKS